MLAACASSGTPRPPATTPGPEAAPVVEQVIVTRVVCPAELDAGAPLRPTVPADAVVEANASGGAWLSAELGYGTIVGVILADARAACEAARGAPPGP